jgi:hypothetical protein
MHPGVPAPLCGKEDLAKLRRMWELFRSDAMHKDESIKLITKAAEEWKT